FAAVGEEVLTVHGADEALGGLSVFVRNPSVDEDRAALARHPERALADPVGTAVPLADVRARSADVPDEVGEPLLPTRQGRAVADRLPLASAPSGSAQPDGVPVR